MRYTTSHNPGACLGRPVSAVANGTCLPPTAQGKQRPCSPAASWPSAPGSHASGTAHHPLPALPECSHSSTGHTGSSSPGPGSPANTAANSTGTAGALLSMQATHRRFPFAQQAQDHLYTQGHRPEPSIQAAYRRHHLAQLSSAACNARDWKSLQTQPTGAHAQGQECG